MYLYCLTQENSPGLSKKTKDKLLLAKSKIARSAARPPLLGWRCALVGDVRILVFSFHLLSPSRRWLRWSDSGFLSEGFSFQAPSFADPLLWSSLFFQFKMKTLKILSLSTDLKWLKESSKRRLINLFFKERIIPRNRKLALAGFIPNQILFSFSSDKDRRTVVRACH